MLSVDCKYANLISGYFRNSKRKDTYLWNFSCPVCNDSQRHKHKARCYIYKLKDNLLVKCHNCGYSTHLGGLIKEVNPILYDEYVMEQYKEQTFNSYSVTTISPLKSIIEPPREDVLAGLEVISELSEDHPAALYVANRGIPKDKWNLLYYCQAFKSYVNTITKKFEDTSEDYPRMIIPYYNRSGEVLFFTGRAYGKETPRYFNVKVIDDALKIYGMERVDFNQPILVVEGAIDSLFLPNALAVSGSSFDIPEIREIKPKVILIMDNEPRNVEIVKQLKKYIDNGYSVCIWPDTIKGKDINEMILNGMSVESILETINKHTFKGLEARLKFNMWDKT